MSGALSSRFLFIILTIPTSVPRLRIRRWSAVWAWNLMPGTGEASRRSETDAWDISIWHSMSNIFFSSASSSRVAGHGTLSLTLGKLGWAACLEAALGVWCYLRPGAWGLIAFFDAATPADRLVSLSSPLSRLILLVLRP